MRQAAISLLCSVTLAVFAVGLTVSDGPAQVVCWGDPTCIQPETGYAVGQPGTPNIEVVSHKPLPGERFSHADIEIEQELDRPFVYIAQRHGASGFYALSIEDEEHPEVLYRYVVDDPDLHLGSGCVDIKYAKAAGRYYVIVSCEFSQAGPDSDLGAMVFDVTGLPDASTVRKVADLRVPPMPGGFHNIFTYRHSNGRSLLVATTKEADAWVYDLEQVAAGVTEPVAAISVPNPTATNYQTWHDIYLGFLPDAGQDRFYGAGGGGFHVYDVTDLENPRLVTSVTGIPGVTDGHTFTPGPTGRFAIGMPVPTYQHSPLRFFDLRPSGS